MNHRTYDGQRFSPLDTDQQGQRQGPQARLRGAARRRRRQRVHEATPLAEDGFLYITDSWGVALQDRRARRATSAASSGAWTRSRRRQLRNRGAALWGNLVITRRRSGRAAHHRDRQGNRQGRLGNQRSSRHARRDASPRRRSPSRTRSSSARPAATSGVRDWIAGARRRDRQAGSGASSPFRRPASPAARPGRTRTTPGRPAAAPSG